MKTKLFSHRDIWVVFKQYEDWLNTDRNKEIYIIVATSLLQEQLDSMSGRS